MKSIDIKKVIANAAKIIAPLWPMQTIIARNPLQGLEELNFEEAVARGDHFLGGSPEVDRSAFSEVNREMIKWCQVFLDEGQATIPMPERDKGFYRAWALLAPFDSQLRKNEWLPSLPSEAEEAILFCLKKMAIPDEQIEDYLKYALAELPGWAGYIKCRAEWQNQASKCKNPITLTDFLAVRLAITCAIQEGGQKQQLKKGRLNSKISTPEFFHKLKNKEDKYLRKLLELVKVNQRKAPLSRPDAQIVFCIDVRSEPLRMRIEREGNYETFGFAGFFGLPVSIQSYHTDQVKDCCPVLLKPRYEVLEEPLPEEGARISRHQKGRRFFRLCQGVYQDLKYNFATPFALAEALGLWCGLWMGVRTLMPIASRILQEQLRPILATRPIMNIPLANQITIAESALRMMGLTKNFSRLVVFCGHGSQTTNNPYASALDCGACGGNHGGPNGKILAAILNSDEVRKALGEKGIAIPDDTLFVGAEHNTTTDEITIEERGDGPHQEIIENLKADFIKAGSKNSQSRCRKLGLEISVADAKKHVLKRSLDWAEVRPEWGLARQAAFIIGPRSLTKNVDLDGRCFLHSYEWDQDEAGKSLEAILTAPMVVAEWINMQYFFSTLNPIAYGSGSKITQNATGKFGMMQGNSSDLMQGLPLQSVNIADDHGYHEAMRLQVVVYAPRSRIDAIVEKHVLLQKLIFNHWVILASIDPIDSKSYRLVRRAEWREISINPLPSRLPLPTHYAINSPLGKKRGVVAAYE